MNLASPARPRRPLPLPCSPTRPGIASPATFHRPPALNGQSCWEKSLMSKTYHVDTEARRTSDKLLFIFYYAFVSPLLIWLDQYFHPKRSSNPGPRRIKFALIRSHSRL